MSTMPDDEGLDRLSQEGSSAEAPHVEALGRQDEKATDREVYLAHELPAEWVAELEKPVTPYETELDGVIEVQEPDQRLGAEGRERARRAARAMEELSRGLTLDGLSLRELIGRDRP